MLTQGNEKAGTSSYDLGEKWKSSHGIRITQFKLENDTEEKELASVRARVEDHVYEEIDLRRHFDTGSMRRMDFGTM